MRHASRVETSHENLFLQRYEALVGWASRLCGQDRQHAEDLVHDAFLAFTLGRPDLDDIENLDGYLRGMLRKLHVSAVRRAARGTHTSLSLIDHDSADLALRAAGAAIVEAKHELECVCRYACARRVSSKAGSVLILRFFHGYFPSEIARVARCSVRVVDEWLRIARREARLFRDAPDRLRFLQEDPKATPITLPSMRDLDEPAECLRAIQDAILQARSGRCSSRRELEAFYRSSSEQSLETARLAHIVSCRRCLEHVNALLGLARLDDRSPHDMTGPDRGGFGGPLGLRRPAKDATRSRERRWRTVYEHRASELQIVVNGFLVGCHTVGREVTRQTVAVTLDEPVGSVEVFGDRGVRLAFLDVEPQPGGSVEQSISVPLSDDRRLRVRISFAQSWPEVDVEYRDPHWRDTDATDADDTSSVPATIPVSTSLANAWRGWTWPRVRPRWKLAIAAGCLVLAMLFAPAGTTAWAAERVAHTIAAIARGLTAISERLRRPRALVSRALLPYAASAPSLPSMAASASVPTDVRAATGFLTEEMLARAEIDALTRLDAIDVLIGGQIEVRKTESHVLVRGLVDEEARKQEVVRTLGPLRRAGAVVIDVLSIADKTSRTATAARTVRYQPLAFEAQSMPAAATLRGILMKGSEWAGARASTVDEEVRRMATAALDASLDARLHAALLRSLAARYDDGELKALSQSAYESWRALLTAHAAAFVADMRTVRDLLEPLLTEATIERDSSLEIDARAPLPLAARLAGLAITIDEVMRANLSASSVRPERVVDLREPGFWNTLQEAERLAEALIQ